MSDEERARFEVLLEDIRTSVGVIAEGHTLLVGKVDAIAGDVGVLKGGVAVLTGAVAGLKSDMAIVKTRLGRIERHVGLNGAGASAKSVRRRPPARNALCRVRVPRKHAGVPVVHALGGAGPESRGLRRAAAGRIVVDACKTRQV